MTKRENYTEIRTIVEKLGRNDLVEFVDHEIELLNKKNASKSDKPTAKQKENEVIKQNILNAMSDKPLTATEIQYLVGLDSNQKTSAMIKQLVDANLLIRTVVKRVSYFTKA